MEKQNSKMKLRRKDKEMGIELNEEPSSTQREGDFQKVSWSSWGREREGKRGWILTAHCSVAVGTRYYSTVR